jgi:anti-sigma factor RsiW
MRREAMDGPTIDAEILRAYLADTLPPGELARVEKALRDSAELRAQLEEVRENRGDLGLHTLGAIWRRGRLSCPTRQQLGSYLLDALDPDLASYLKFHLEVIACPYCQANVADLRSKGAQVPAAIESRYNRIVQSSRHLLGGEEEPRRDGKV